MTIVIPDARTPAGVKCWVRDSENSAWLERNWMGESTSDNLPFFTGEACWRYCRLDDPVEGWVENTGVQPVADSTKVEVKFAKAAPSAVSAASNWHWSIEFAVGDITHWRYPRETKEKPMAPHPQADILRRIADGEDLTDRLWCLDTRGKWFPIDMGILLDIDKSHTLAVSDEPGVPPPLPRKMIQLRPGGPKYYRGETVAPGDETRVWLARAGFDDEVNSDAWLDWSDDYKSNALRLGLVHLSEANYKLHMAALEDLMLWAHEGGVK